MRDKLKEARRRDSQRLRKAHGAAMGALKSLDTADSPSALRAGIAAARPHVGALPALEEEVSAAESRLQELSVASEPAAVERSGMAVAADWPHEGDQLKVLPIPLAPLQEATEQFSSASMVGKGGCASVYRGALPHPEAGSCLVAVKKMHEVHSSSELQALEREITILRQCRHPHLLPLLGHCLDLAAPCLVFPLMTGGSLESRLRLAADDCAQLRRLGLFADREPKPLTWRQRLRIVREAVGALAYLHGAIAGGKPAVIHRDFKPANILLDERLTAYLSDTGFAKSAATGAAASLTTRSGACYTPGYADQFILSGEGHSVITDGYAVGITLLVILTNRSPLDIVPKIEAEHDADFEDIRAERFAQPAWPTHVAQKLAALVHSRSDGLCHPKRRKRIELARVLETLDGCLASSGGEAAEDAPAAAAAAAAVAAADDARASYVPSAPSLLVRKLGSAAAATDGAAKVRGLQRKSSDAFDALVRRLDAVYAPHRARAPSEFKVRLDFWRGACAMPERLHAEMHTLRVWRNAAEHHDAERWARDGPSGEDEFVRLVERLGAAVGKLEAAAR